MRIITKKVGHANVKKSKLNGKKKIEMNKSKVDLSYLLGQYIKSCEVRGQSPVTINDKEHKLGHFVEYVGDQELTQGLYDDYILTLKGRGLKNRSINAHIVYINTFIKWIGKSIHESLLRQEEPIKDVYTASELKVLLKIPKKDCPFSEYRNWVLTNFLLSTGVRIGSVPDIMIEDVDLDNRTIIIRHVKNRKHYYVYISDALYTILVEYIAVVSAVSEYLFPNVFGEKACPKSLALCIRRYNLARGVNKTSVHAYRRTYAQMSLLNGCDIFSLQRLMGHSSLNSTKEYLKLCDEDVHSQFVKYNPLDIFIRENVKKKI